MFGLFIFFNNIFYSIYSCLLFWLIFFKQVFFVHYIIIEHFCFLFFTNVFGLWFILSRDLFGINRWSDLFLNLICEETIINPNSWRLYLYKWFFVNTDGLSDSHFFYDLYLLIFGIYSEVISMFGRWLFGWINWVVIFPRFFELIFFLFFLFSGLGLNYFIFKLIFLLFYYFLDIFFSFLVFCWLS